MPHYCVIPHLLDWKNKSVINNAIKLSCLTKVIPHVFSKYLALILISARQFLRNPIFLPHCHGISRSLL